MHVEWNIVSMTETTFSAVLRTRSPFKYAKQDIYWKLEFSTTDGLLTPKHI